MNRLPAILAILFLAAFAQYAHAGAVTPAAEPTWTVEGEATGPVSPAIAGADSESTEGYESRGTMGTGETPESVAPVDEMNRGDSPSVAAPEGEGAEGVENPPPSDTGNLPETVEPGKEPEGTGVPSEEAPGWSY